MRISNQAIENMLYDEDEKESGQKKKKIISCTKCKGSEFNTQDELRQHFKSNWHKFNAKQSAHGKESFNANEFDEYILMHPEALA